MNTLEQLRADYEALGQRIAELEKTEQDPWDGVKEYWGWELLSNAPHVTEIKGAWYERRECNHFWRAVDSRRSQCSKCGEIEKSPCREPECVALQARIDELESHAKMVIHTRGIHRSKQSMDVAIDALAALLEAEK